MYRCLKTAEFVRLNPTLWRARNAFQAAQLEPHIISSQGDPIRSVHIRATSKTWSDYPPRLSDDDFVPMFTYLQRDRFAELTTWAGKRVTALAGWPKTPRSLATHLRRIAPQMRMHGVSITFLRTSEKRFIEIMSTKPPIPEESPHVSASGIERCSDDLIHGDPDAAQIHATA